jgi:hypothetical protein
MRSVITLIPSPIARYAISCAWMSVGKPGYGCVVISIGLIRRDALTKIVPFWRSIFTPDLFQAIDDRDQVIEVAVLQLEFAVG